MGNSSPYVVRFNFLFLARVFPPLHGNKGFGPVWGFALSTGIRPRVIQYPLRTPLKLYGLCCFSLVPLLPARASALSLFAGLRLPSSPALSLWLVLSACLVVRCPGWCFLLPLLRGCGLVCWRGLVFVWLDLSGFSVCWCFGLFSLFCVLRLMASPDVSLDWDIYILLSPAPLRPSLIIVLVYLDRFTYTVEFHRSTTSYFNWFRVTIR